MQNLILTSFLTILEKNSKGHGVSGQTVEWLVIKIHFDNGGSSIFIYKPSNVLSLVFAFK